MCDHMPSKDGMAMRLVLWFGSGVKILADTLRTGSAQCLE